jgi:hypothetical protein
MLHCASSLVAAGEIRDSSLFFMKNRELSPFSLTPRDSRALPAAFLRSRPISRVSYDLFSRSSFIGKRGSLRRCFIPREGHSAHLERLGDLLLIRLLIVEGDTDRVVRRNPEADDTVYTLEDRTYPRGGSSGVASGTIQLNRLFRRGDRCGNHKEQHKKTPRGR